MPRQIPTPLRRPRVTITQPNGAKPREAPPPANPDSRKPPGPPPKKPKNEADV